MNLININFFVFNLKDFFYIGNKFGEPVVAGFTRSFGQRLVNGERVEWIKPVMFTAGVGMINDLHTVKGNPEVGLVVCKVGGPAYRIGMGGGAASSRAQPADGIIANILYSRSYVYDICQISHENTLCFSFLYPQVYIILFKDNAILCTLSYDDDNDDDKDNAILC